MLNMNMLKSAAVTSRLFLMKNAPTIMTSVGVVGVVAGTVLACKATLKVDSVIKESDQVIDKIKTAKETVDVDIYSEDDYKRDLAIAYIQKGTKIVRLYAPAILVGAVSIGLIIGSHRIMTKRNVALTAAYKVLDESFNRYRSRVIEDYGADKDKDYRLGVRSNTVIEQVVNENGETVEVEKKVKAPSRLGKTSPYATLFSKETAKGNWDDNPVLNMYFLKSQQAFLNNRLQREGFLFLNEVLEALGIERTTGGQVVGWILGRGDDFVDFGIDFSDHDNPDYAQEIWLDFNVAGVMYDII